MTLGDGLSLFGLWWAVMALIRSEYEVSATTLGFFVVALILQGFAMFFRRS